MSMRGLTKHLKPTASLVVILVMIGYSLYRAHERDKWYDLNIIQHDVNYLYSYLPAYFIYDDMTYEYRFDADSIVQEKTWLLETDQGQVSKMTMGAAVLYAPGFLIAHQLAKWKGLPANGYSWIYHYSLTMSAIMYVFLGLLLLRSVLRKYFTEWVTALTLAGVYICTNLFHYTIVESGMTHVYSFFLFALFLRACISWFEEQRLSTTLLLGATLGLIVLVRPTNAVLVLIPLFYATTISKKKLIQRNWKKLVAAVVVAFLVVLPQLLYWKSHTGDWLHFSYHDERFYFGNPHILEGLFSYRKGLLVYTPVMALAFIGFYWLRDRMPKLFVPIVLFTAVNLYVVFSWWCWWYGGSYGSRALIESFVILAIPMAVAIEKIMARSLWRIAIMTVVIGLFTHVSLVQTEQYRITLIHWDSMTKDAYWGVFLKDQFPENYADLLQAPDYEAAKQGKDEY